MCPRNLASISVQLSCWCTGVQTPRDVVVGVNGRRTSHSSADKLVFACFAGSRRDSHAQGLEENASRLADVVSEKESAVQRLTVLGAQLQELQARHSEAEQHVVDLSAAKESNEQKLETQQQMRSSLVEKCQSLEIANTKLESEIRNFGQALLTQKRVRAKEKAAYQERLERCKQELMKTRDHSKAMASQGHQNNVRFKREVRKLRHDRQVSTAQHPWCQPSTCACALVCVCARRGLGT